MKKIILLIIAFCFIFTSVAAAANIALQWNESATATGYKIYQSTDMGLTWDAGLDVGNVTTHVVPGVPDSGLVLFKVGAYNSNGESIRLWSGAWHNGDWQIPADPGVTGIE